MQSDFPVELIQRLSGATDRANHVSLRDVYRGGAECSTLDSASASISIHPRTSTVEATFGDKACKAAGIDELIALNTRKQSRMV